MKYLIERITDKYGVDRVDGRYLYRIGSIAEFQNILTEGCRLFFRYIKKDNAGNVIYDNITMTTTVNHIEYTSTHTVVHTNNSIYYFKKIQLFKGEI